jgi:hypothetical protein
MGVGGRHKTTKSMRKTNDTLKRMPQTGEECASECCRKDMTVKIWCGCAVRSFPFLVCGNMRFGNRRSRSK